MNGIAKPIVGARPRSGRNAIAHGSPIALQLRQNKECDVKIEVGGRKNAGRGGGRFGNIGRLGRGVHFVGDGDIVRSVARRRGEVELGDVELRGPLGTNPAGVHGGGERVAVVGVQVCTPEAAVGADT